jgi:hypothetical protein
MRKIVLDENGNPIDELAIRNEEIILKLQPKMDLLIKEKNADTKGNKRFGFRAMMQIEDELGQFPMMSAEKFVELDYDDIEYFWRSFHALMAHYNMLFEIVPTRQTYMLYMGVNSRMYKHLVNGGEHSDDDIKDLMAFIEDRLVGKAFTAGESGNADVKAVSSRLRAKEVGHDVISASEDKLIQTEEARSELELMKEYRRVMGMTEAPKLPKG